MNFQKQYDIIVGGAGVAGIAAALAAARRGHSVALIEKQTLIGGLATSGLILVYLPLCDGNGTQVTFGIAEELLRRSLEYSPFDVSAAWGGMGNLRSERYQCFFSPAGFTLSLDKALREAGVDLWLDTLICTAETDNCRITSLEVENNSGRGRLTGTCFVDATGNATLVRRAGGHFVGGRNYNTPWIMERSGDTGQFPLTDKLHVKVLGALEEKYLADGDPLDGESVTRFTRNAWQMLRNNYDVAYSKGFTDRNECFPVHLPAMAQFRKIARIRGKATLKSTQYATRFPDSVGLCADWRKAGHVWETPYGILLPENVRGVLAAGRCVSADGDAWEIYRVIPAAAMTGEVAGVAAALCVELKCLPDELNIARIQNILRERNFAVHLDEIGRCRNRCESMAKVV